MVRKRALIVDDSKSARVILCRMLEQHDIEVDMSESAEQAIEYLEQNRPDAIFMDHLMPGMDGLQAVRAIKGNPQTAMIPIMMYTSQEGELYVGQARALGAMGVLPKQVRPVDVAKVLYELHLLPDRRDAQESALLPIELEPGATPERVAEGVGRAGELQWSGAEGVGRAGESQWSGAEGVGRAGESHGSGAEGSGRAGELQWSGAEGVGRTGESHGSGAEGSGRTGESHGSGAEWGRRVESTIKQQAVDLRRFMVASLDNLASRIMIELRDSPTAAKFAPHPAVAVAPPAPPPVRAPWPGFAAAGALGIALLVVCALWIDDRTELANLRTRVADVDAANAQLTRARQDLAENVKDLTAALGALEAMPFAAPAPTAALLASRTESVPYGEMPLDRGRSDALRELVAKLEQQGFRGVVKVTSFPGLFCLTGNPSDGLTPAAAALPFNKCDAVANPYDDASSGQLRQSLAFANLIAGIRQLSGGAITVVIENAPSGRALMPYPARSEALTAGEWNKAAAANNRVEFTVEPAAR
jgi:CheY-like chemotaxis protein